MSTILNFSDELGHWLRHNLERGCHPDDLVRAMLAQRFDESIAIGLVQAFKRTRDESGQWPEHAVVLGEGAGEYVYDHPRLPAGHCIPTPDREVPVLMRMARPIIAVMGEVLNATECDHLMALARPRLKPSTIVDAQTGEDKVAEHRDSDSMFFRLEEDAFIARLDRRISALMNGPVDHGEGLQVVRYGPGARNTPHFDFLVPSHAANRASLARSGQRVSTLVIYLNDVAGGGETVFPEIGLAVTPRKGHAVYFEYANRLRQVDPLSVHAGAAVTEGEKWIVTKWMRERRFMPAAANLNAA